MSAPRRWARRAALSALAGGGLTAAGLGGPMVGGALGAEAPVGTTGTTESPPPPPVTETVPQAPAPAPGGAEQSTTTSTASAPTSTSAEPSSTSTAPSSPAPSNTVTTPSAPAPAADAQATPTVVVQRSQQITHGRRHGASVTGSGSGKGGVGTSGQGGSASKGNGEGAAKNTPGTVPAGTPNGVAPAPLAAGGEAGALTTLFAGSAVSAQALDFYRIPLFLLPVYQAAAFQYDVPWQILAAINEIETDYGTDLSVSTAGAVGWMQFMPSTWLRYGVDATNAGYADPYNPVDAIFAAARYLHAAGASRNLHAAIFAYNHSQEYLESVLLRARLIASYPSAVIATLTGLVDGRAPTAGARLSPGASSGLAALPPLTGAGSAPAGVEGAPANPSSSSSSSNATAGAVPASAADPTSTAAGVAPTPTAAAAGAVPGSKPAPPPKVSAARAQAAANAPAKPSQLVDLLGTPGAPVVAVEDGRIEHLGHSHALGRYLVLRDIYGDVFTYAGLGSIASHYRPTVPRVEHRLAAAHEPAPRQAATAGHQPPLTLAVKRRAEPTSLPSAATEPEGETVPAGMGRVRLFAHPGNPIARVAARRAARAASAANGAWRPLRTGSIISEGTVLGHLDKPTGAGAGQLRFAIRPAGDNGTIDPQPLLANWRELGAALHPKGSRATGALLGATAQDALQMSKGELARAVLSDPGIQLDRCGRRDVAAGAVDRRLLAVLEFLSRSGLQPTVSGLRCPRGGSSATGVVPAGDATSAARTAHARAAELGALRTVAGTAVDISAINGIPIAGHQGQGSVTDAAIRALLTLHGQFAPHRIVSLMKYPEASTTEALPAAWDRIHIDFLPPRHAVAHASATGPAAAAPLAVTGDLSEAQWSELIKRIATLPKPTIAIAPSSAAVRDPQTPAQTPAERGLGGGGQVTGN
jgi:Transglycosylase SLT domain